MICQLMHAGALSQGNRYTNETIAPSSVKPKGEQLAAYGGKGEYKIPREMSQEDINHVIKTFAESARRAKQAGFDGVEIHGANGYLLDQFLTDYTNQRKDQYGGSTENRVRICQEIIAEVRKAVGYNFIVGIRISLGKVNDYYHKWAMGEKDAEIIFKSLGEEKPDYIHITDFDAVNPAFGEEGPTLAQLARKYSLVPIILNGQLEDPEKAEKVLSTGDADLISLGKGALANPDWVKKVKSDEALKTFDFDVLQPDATVKDKELLHSIQV